MSLEECPLNGCRADAVHFHYLDDDGPGVECLVGGHEYHFAELWEQCAPYGSTFTYDDEGYLVVTTPDGTRYTAWTAIGADDQPTTRTMEVSQ